ncbi:MAG: hypothetical protein ACLQHS_00815 [Candidatus Limnocylindrales bacterium]
MASDALVPVTWLEGRRGAVPDLGTQAHLQGRRGWLLSPPAEEIGLIV